jgi:hypothetical protein
VVISVVQIIVAIQLRLEIANEWFLALGEAISVLFGFYVFSNPGWGALALMWLRALRPRLRRLADCGWVPAPRASGRPRGATDVSAGRMSPTALHSGDT